MLIRLMMMSLVSLQVIAVSGCDDDDKLTLSEQANADIKEGGSKFNDHILNSNAVLVQFVADQNALALTQDEEEPWGADDDVIAFTSRTPTLVSDEVYDGIGENSITLSIYETELLNDDVISRIEGDGSLSLHLLNLARPKAIASNIRLGKSSGGGRTASVGRINVRPVAPVCHEICPMYDLKTSSTNEMFRGNCGTVCSVSQPSGCKETKIVEYNSSNLNVCTLKDSSCYGSCSSSGASQPRAIKAVIRTR